MRGDGAMSWGDHHPCLFTGTEKFFRPGYKANLVASWLPALDGVTAKLEAGAKVADVGCGHGASTIILAQAYPNSTFHGYDFHAPSIAAAQERAADGGVADRITFSQARPRNTPTKASTSSASSTAFTTWATPSAQHATPTKLSPMTALFCSLSHSQETASRTTATRSGGCSTPLPPPSAHRIRCPKRSAARWGTGRRSTTSSRCSPKPASRTSDVRPRPRST